MTVTLAPEMEQLIAEKVRSGRYPSAEAVVQEAIHLLEERDAEQDIRLAAVRNKLERALADVEAGRLISGEQIWERLGRPDPR